MSSRISAGWRKSAVRAASWSSMSLVRGRAGRARLHAERAVVRRPGRRQGDGARHLGRSAGRRPRAAAGRHRGRENPHERLRRFQARNACCALAPATPSSTPARGPICRSSTPHAPAPTKATSSSCPRNCCSTMNADWHRASVQYAMQNVAAGDQIQRGHRRAGVVARHPEPPKTLSCALRALSSPASGGGRRAELAGRGSAGRAR